MIAYHIDRARTLRTGETIELIKPTSGIPFIDDVMENRFPDGLSRFGMRYYANQGAALLDENGQLNSIELPNINSYLIDNVFELERRISFPQMPSRMQCIFASESLEEAMDWHKQLPKNGDAPIWEIEIKHDDYKRLDSNWLKGEVNKMSFLAMTYYANGYWSGSPYAGGSHYELLVKLPITVKGRAT